MRYSADSDSRNNYDLLAPRPLDTFAQEAFLLTTPRHDFTTPPRQGL